MLGVSSVDKKLTAVFNGWGHTNKCRPLTRQSSLTRFGMPVGIKLSDTPMPDREFIKHVDMLLETGRFNPDVVAYLDAYQWHTIRHIKNYYERQRRKEKGHDQDMS